MAEACGSLSRWNLIPRRPLCHSDTSLVSLTFAPLRRVCRPYPASFIPHRRRPKPCADSQATRHLYHQPDFSSYHTAVTSIDSDSRHTFGHCEHLILPCSPSRAERIFLQWPHLSHRTFQCSTRAIYGVNHLRLLELGFRITQLFFSAGGVQPSQRR